MSASSERRRTVVLRVAPATIVMFSLVFAPVLLMGLSLLWKGRQPMSGVALCSLYIAAVWWMCGRTVELAPGQLIYRVFFVAKRFTVSELESATVVATPAPTLQLRHRGSRQIESAFILKPFSRAGVVAILQHIQHASPGVKLGAVAKDMSEGKFETVTRESIKAVNLLRLVLLAVAVVILGALARRLLG